MNINVLLQTTANVSREPVHPLSHRRLRMCRPQPQLVVRPLLVQLRITSGSACAKMHYSILPYIFVTFWIYSGDSYTETGFTPGSTAPAVGNPLGNPPFPVSLLPFTEKRYISSETITTGLHSSRRNKLDRSQHCPIQQISHPHLQLCVWWSHYRRHPRSSIHIDCLIFDWPGKPILEWCREETEWSAMDEQRCLVLILDWN